MVDTLRERWGFDGWVETDRLAMHSTVQSMNVGVSYELAAAGVTLLKNEEGILPLNAAEVRTIALIGHQWYAGSATIPPRNGDPRELTTVVSPFTISPEEGLSAYVSRRRRMVLCSWSGPHLGRRPEYRSIDQYQ